MRYQTIVADPPWQYERGFVSLPGQNIDTQRRVDRALPYEAMDLGEICVLPVSDWAADDSVLWLWTTNRYLRQGFAVMTAWGFRYTQTLVWRKTGNPSPFGGSVAPIHNEFLLVGKRGSPRCGRLETSVIDAPSNAGNRQGTHSRKPEKFIDLIEGVSPEPRLEMFARRARLSGWDYWGNESLQTASVA